MYMCACVDVCACVCMRFSLWSGVDVFPLQVWSSTMQRGEMVQLNMVDLGVGIRTPLSSGSNYACRVAGIARLIVSIL